MTSRSPGLLYVLLKHDPPGPDGKHIIDGAVDRLSVLPETLGSIPIGVQLAGLKHTLKKLRCNGSPELQIRVAEAESHISGRSLHSEAEDHKAVSASLGRTMEAAAVFYALQRLMHKFAGAAPLNANALRQLLQSQTREKFLAGVALDIESFAEELEATTLKMQSRLLSLLALKKSLPELYGLLSSRQNSATAKTRFRTVPMKIGDRDASLSPTKTVNVFLARRAFSMEAYAGRSVP